MKRNQLIEIDVDIDRDLWNECTTGLHNGWGNLENDIHFAFKIKDSGTEELEDEISDFVNKKFPTANVEVMEVEPDDAEEGWRYFGVSCVIYNFYEQ